MVDYERISVPVRGGSLTAGRWGDGPTVVIASHGITANHVSWKRVGELVVEGSDGAVSLVAVDHRGRAGSAGVPGPYGLAAHADDLVATLDHLGVKTAVFAGHSMGAFVVANAAERHPSRTSGLVLVDGGVPFAMQVPDGTSVEEAIRAVIGPALDRLDMRWPDVESYVDFFRRHPAFQPPNEWSPTVEAYVREDAVVDANGEVRSSVVKEAVLVDGGAAITDPDSSSAIERVRVPTWMLWATRGLLDQTPGLYSQRAVDDLTGRLRHVTAQEVDDTNHYTILVGESGAQDVAFDGILGMVRDVTGE